MEKKYIVDTSVIFRLYDKDESKKEEAKGILEKENVYVPAEVVTELFYLLRKSLKYSKRKAIDEIKKIVGRHNVETDREVEKALKILEESGIDSIVDALVIVKAYEKNYGLITNDETQAKVFQKLRGEEPDQEN